MEGGDWRRNGFWEINLEFFFEHEKFEMSLAIQLGYQISCWIYKPGAWGEIRSRGIYLVVISI